VIDAPIPIELSPAPKLSLPTDVVVDLAWEVLLVSVGGPGSFDQLSLQLHEISGQQLRPKRARERLSGWMESGKPLKCIRLVHPPRERARFSPEEARNFLTAITGDELDRAVQGWKICVSAGMEPEAAWQGVSNFRLRDRALPTGQWIGEDDIAPLMRHSADVVMLPGGQTIDTAAVEAIRDTARQGRKIAAIKKLRDETGMGLRDCKKLVEDLMDGLLLGPIARTGSLPPIHKQAQKKGRSKARKRLEACIDELLRDRPLHWVILAGTKIIEDPSIATMAVGLTRRAQPVLFFNPRFTLRISRGQCKGVLLHEINHVLFGHVNDQPVEALEHTHAWMLACEVTANEFIPYPLPGHPITLGRLGLEPMQSTLERFEQLRVRDDLPATSCSGPILTQALEDDPENHRDISFNALRYPAGVLLDAAELVADEVDRCTAAAVVKHAGIHAGRISSFLEPEGLPTLPWHDYLKKLAKGLRVRISTMRYPSRRAPDRIGIVPGRRSQREDPVVLAAVDTSGSMTNAELSQVADELTGLLRERVRVAYIQCDTRIVLDQWLRGSEAPRTALGRGGTDLRPPFSRSVLARYQPDLIVYFTDGYGPAPTSPPPGLQVLWVLTGAQPTLPARYGKVVCMRPRHRRERLSQS